MDWLTLPESEAFVPQDRLAATTRASAGALLLGLRDLLGEEQGDSGQTKDVRDPTMNTIGSVGLVPVSEHDPLRSVMGSDPKVVSGPLNTLAEVTSYLLLFLLIFGLSATVDMPSLMRQLRNKFAICTGVAMQFLVMPFLGFVAVTVLKRHGLEAHSGMTLLIVLSSPGGSYSNWWCSTFNADLALSVAMTALSTLLSTILLPANLLLYAHAAYGVSNGGGDGILSHVDWSSLFVSLAVVITAIFLGLFASYKIHSQRFRRWSNRLGTFSGLALVIFSAAFSSGSGSSDASLWGQHWSFYVGVASPCAVGLLISNALARAFRLKKPEVVTLSVECCYQNVGIATSAAMAMFNDPHKRAEALCVPLFYGFVEAAILGFYCVASWKLGWTKAPAKEKLCVVIGRTYEVEDTTDESEDVLGHHGSSETDTAERDASGEHVNQTFNGLDNESECLAPSYHGPLSRGDIELHVRNEENEETHRQEEAIQEHYSTLWLGSIVDFFARRRQRRQSFCQTTEANCCSGVDSPKGSIDEKDDVLGCLPQADGPLRPRTRTASTERLDYSRTNRGGGGFGDTDSIASESLADERRARAESNDSVQYEEMEVLDEVETITSDTIITTPSSLDERSVAGSTSVITASTTRAESSVQGPGRYV